MNKELPMVFTRIIRIIFTLVIVLIPALSVSIPQPSQDEIVDIDRNIQVENQLGHLLNFYQDLIKSKTVVINFIFTTCTSSCPLSSAVFRQVQKKLRLQPVQFITVSVDPVNDTPERLLEFSKKFAAEPNWAFVTGEQAVISGLLKNLGAYTGDKNGHSNMVIVGNDANHQWTQLYGFPQAKEILMALKKVTAKSNNK